MDLDTVVLILAIVATVLAAIEVFRTNAQSFAADAAVILGIALIVAYWPA